jgi:hypothetical protein
MRSSGRVTLLLGLVLAALVLLASSVAAHGNHPVGDIAGQNRKPHHGHGHNHAGNEHDNLEDEQEVTPPVDEPATSSQPVQLPTFTVLSYDSFADDSLPL